MLYYYAIIVHLSCSRSIYRVCRILVHIFLTNDILKEYYINTTAEEATIIIAGVRYAFYRRLSNDYSSFTMRRGELLYLLIIL